MEENKSEEGGEELLLFKQMWWGKTLPGEQSCRLAH